MTSKSRAEGFGDEVQRRILIGTYALSAGYTDAYYKKAQKVRTLIRKDFDNAFKKVDILLTPTCPTTAFLKGDFANDPLSMYSKLEKVPDNIIPTYFELLTEIDLSLLENSNPRELQRRMALEVTTLFHGAQEALKAQSNCEKLFLGQKEKVGEIPEISLKDVVFPVKFFYLLSALKLFKSSSESKRSIKGGGVKIDSEKVINPDLVFNSKNDLEGKILQIGKKIIKRFEN